MLSHSELIARIAVGAALGGSIGFERDADAGLRSTDITLWRAGLVRCNPLLARSRRALCENRAEQMLGVLQALRAVR